MTGNTSFSAVPTVFTCQQVIAIFASDSSRAKSEQTTTNEWAEAIVYNVLFGLVSTLGTVGNGLVILVVAWNKTMRNPRNVFITNLALADLAAAATLFPFVRLPMLENYWKYGSWACKFYNVFSGMNVFASALTITAISADRYVAIRRCRPDTSPQLGPFLLLSGLIWLASLGFSCPLGIFYSADVSTIHFETIEQELNVTIVCSSPDMPRVIETPPFCSYNPPSKTASIILSVLHTTFLVPVPFASLTYFNYQIHAFIKQKNAATQRCQSLVSTAPQVESRRYRRHHSSALKVERNDDCGQGDGGQKISISSNAPSIYRKCSLPQTLLLVASRMSFPSDILSASASNDPTMTPDVLTPITESNERPMSQSDITRPILASNFTKNNSNGARKLPISPRKFSIMPLQTIQKASIQHLISRTLTKREKRHRKLSILLISMAVSHALLWLPFTVLSWLFDFHRQIFEGQTGLFQRLDVIAQLIAYTSLAVNPFLYAFFNSNFRREFQYLGHCCAKGSRAKSSVVSTNLVGNRIGKRSSAQKKRTRRTIREYSRFSHAESRI